MEQYFMKQALKLAKEAFKKEEVPVGAVIVKNEKIIGFGKNEQYQTKKGYRHAEFNAINNALKKETNLENSTIYITLEPCLFCFGYIVENKIKKIIYAADSPKYGFSKYIKGESIFKKTIVEKLETKGEEAALLKEFFQNKR